MDNLRKFSKPPSSLNFSQRTDDGSGSSESTPIEDYKTPSLEHSAGPSFEFAPHEGEPAVPEKLHVLTQNASCQQSHTHNWSTGFRLEPDTSFKSLQHAGIASSLKSVLFYDDQISQLSGSYGSLINGNTPRTRTTSATTMPYSKYSNKDNLVPLMRSPPTFSRQMKKTTFAALPNQTSWLEETVQRGASMEQGRTKPASDIVACLPTELSGIRLKLEERRKQIEHEKKRMEMQWSKQRQQVGKEAFIQVVTKNQLGSTSQTDLRTEPGYEKPSYYHEMSDGGLMLNKQQEKKVNSMASPHYGTDKEMNFSQSAQSMAKGYESLKGGVVSSGVGERKTRNLAEQSFGSNVMTSSGSCDCSKTVQLNSPKNPTEAKADEKIPEGIFIGKAGKGEISAGYHSDISEYSTSLDRLNSSLSELQGEIMRLSLQQDQIKSLVGSEIDPPVQSLETYSTPVAVKNSKEQFYLFPRNTIYSSGTRQLSITGVCGSSSSGIYKSTVSSSYRSPTSNVLELSVSTASVSSSNTKVSGSSVGLVTPDVAGVQLHDDMYPAGSGSMPPFYASSQYFTPLHAHFLAGSHYSMPLANPLPPSLSSFPGHLPFSEQGPLNYAGHGISSSLGAWQTAVSTQVSGETFANTPKDVSPASADTSGMHQFSESLAFCHSNVAEVPSCNATSKMPQMSGKQNSLSDLDPVNYGISLHTARSASPAFLSCPGSCINSSSLSLVAASNSSNIPSHQDESVELMSVPAPSEAFFMALDPDLPRRPKPVLNTNYRKKEVDVDTGQQNCPLDYQDFTSTSSSAVSDNKMERAVDQQKGRNMATCDAAISIGFIIGDNESALDETMQHEVEKKRQKMAELHQKRREDLEQKRQKIEMEQQTKREALRLKQEKSDQKKAKEKARREEIFQNYLQRKGEEDGSEEDAKPQPLISTKRQIASKTKASHPKSQPLPSSVVTRNEGEPLLNAQSSTGGLLTHVRTGSSGSDFSKSNENINVLVTNFEQLEAQLSFGNLSQRALSATDRVPRFVSSSSDGGSDGGVSGSQLPDNYAGPKLFVKPSQKSNRHIIANAIKDCCLAGMVNQDMKNKVLEEISKSDSKHFVILFRDASMQYRGLYTYNPDREDVFKIHGVGPNRLLDKMMERFYKYNSGAKHFTEVTSTKHLSATIDAVTILGTLWQKKPSTVQGKKPV